MFVRRNLVREAEVKDKYDIVYADPAWPYFGDPNKDQAAGKHYNLMTLDEIKALPIREIIHSKSVLLLWTTSSHLADAVEVMPAWGFHFRGVFQVWGKTRKDGNLIHGQGVRPSFTKPTAEYLLVGSAQKRGRPLPVLTEAMANVVEHEDLPLEAIASTVVAHPRPTLHSQKPDVFRDNIVALFGDRPRIELFARKRYLGWSAWGNELPEQEGG